MLEWTHAGVDYNLAGNGGEECVNFLTQSQIWLETTVFTILALAEMAITYPMLSLPEPLPRGRIDQSTRRFLLAATCLSFGIELGFKFATQQVIWLLNPCHVVTLMQIYLLVVPHSRTSMFLFRLHMHWLQGATIALLLPVINTRLLSFETEIYFLQHSLMLIVPYFMMREKGAFTPEPLSNITWVIFSYATIFLYHFVVLQGVGHATMANLNSMLCPAVSDPFYGPHYRTWAWAHQTLLVLTHGKLYTWAISYLLPASPPPPQQPSTSTATVANGTASDLQKLD